jgi:predicted TIM-barrel fold metal-dependent hydrolase
MTEAGVDLAINLPVVTNPAQFESVNNFASEINAAYRDSATRLISFGGIHPACEDIRGKMRQIKEQGMLGVKIHPDYQETFIDDDGYVEILSAAKELDLIVVTHSGVDCGYLGKPVRCTPERVARLIDRVGHEKFVLAHMGANEMEDEVLEYLCGKNVYFDTAYVLQHIKEEKFKAILEGQGEDKILFASDSPWGDMIQDVKWIGNYRLSKETENKIFYENGKRLLGI